MNGNYAVSVHAEDTEPESGSEENSTENETEQETESGSEENSTEEDTVSGGDVKEPECTCEDKCGAYEYDHNCEVSVESNICHFIDKKEEQLPKRSLIFILTLLHCK
ncbi:Uncharacterised protein [Roseburia intestinalis]|uniref:Uncharacterized protein n=3 Tax=Roseburia intestinalis TaxID=166486 RepID=A0A6N3EP63_9FIRM